MIKIPKRRHAKRAMNEESGFTIIELLIATVVFSLVMLILTYGILQISRTYYKGVTSANTQNTARDVIDNISQAIQFSGQGTGFAAIPSTNGSLGFCIGNQRYSYLPGYQLLNGTVDTTANQTNYAFVVDTPASCNPISSSAQDLVGITKGTVMLAPGSKELMGLHMRLADLMLPASVSDNLYNIHIRVVYGDNDLLCSETAVASSCSSTTTMPSGGDYAETDLSCKGQAGDQFCAVSDLNTIVQKRIQ